QSPFERRDHPLRPPAHEIPGSDDALQEDRHVATGDRLELLPRESFERIEARESELLTGREQQSRVQTAAEVRRNGRMAAQQPFRVALDKAQVVRELRQHDVAMKKLVAQFGQLTGLAIP